MLSDFGLQSNPINLKVKSYVSWPPVRFQIQLPWRLLSVLLYTSGVSESSRDLKAVVFSLSLLKRKEKNQQQTQFGIYSHPLVSMGNCFQDPKCKITWIAPKSMDTQIPYYCLQLVGPPCPWVSHTQIQRVDYIPSPCFFRSDSIGMLHSLGSLA